MASLSNSSQLANAARAASCSVDSRSSTPLHDMPKEQIIEFKFPPNQKLASTQPSTRSMSQQPSETSEMTVPAGLFNGGIFSNASSVTLQDEFPWHEVGINENTRRIPPTIFPALLQGLGDVSSSRSSFDGAEDSPDEDKSDPDAVPRYPASQKGKWKASTNDSIVEPTSWARLPSPEFFIHNIHSTAEDWVVHNRPVLQEYADRQIRMPLGSRLQVSIDEPSQSVLGAIQLLVNRDQKGCDRSRQLGPQLIENFVDIDRWAKEYFRSRYSSQSVDNDVSILLTIVMNNFYEGQVQLIDRLVEFALENMRFCGRNSLRVEDFSFGFDFKMSQDLPFHVETSSRIRKPLPIRAVETTPTSEPTTTSSGRQVKPTLRAQAASEQAQKGTENKRNKGKGTKAKDKEVANNSVVPTHQKKKSTRCTSGRTTQDTLPPQDETRAPKPKTTSRRTKNRPARPSNLGLPPILPNSKSDNISKSKPNVSVPGDNPKISGLKIVLPRLSLPASNDPAKSDSGSSTGDTNSNSSTAASANALQTTNKLRGTSHSGSPRSRNPRNVHRSGRGRERETETPTLPADTGTTSDKTKKAQCTELSVDVGDEGLSATSFPAMHHPTLVDTTLRGGVCAAFRARPLGGENSNDLGIGDDGRCASENAHTGQSLGQETDPCHPQRKKRKLNECEN